jgi:hypothetical protein
VIDQHRTGRRARQRTVGAVGHLADVVVVADAQEHELGASAASRGVGAARLPYNATQASAFSGVRL